MKTLGPETDNLIGGDREIPTRAMFLAGVAWIDAHPGVPVPFVLTSDKRMVPVDENAESLLAAILAAAPEPKTAIDESMVQTAINHCSFVRMFGWERYLRKMRRPEKPPARCLRTGNPVGTNTWGARPCDCAICAAYLSGEKWLSK